jgi:hypothetical protein
MPTDLSVGLKMNGAKHCPGLDMNDNLSSILRNPVARTEIAACRQNL